ncbi:accessory gene regulator ArgB-like protein [Paenibacillus yanchengensis]|uniref:Accessory gene regulator ArgB-like protein n=1 Tax=Paenibacillus yanchengensis TaxID=2035833 RepID=A0ABW4YFU0_9BACL
MTSMARNLALIIKKANPDETVSVAVMEYALAIIFNYLFIFFTSLIIGYFTDSLGLTILALFVFTIIRMLSGGVHIKSIWGCIIVSVLLCVLIPQISYVTSNNFTLLFNIISLLCMFFFAPSPDKNSRIDSKYFKHLKLASIIMIGSNFFINSAVIALCFLAQSITILPFRREGK